jgi:hypothetical protein
VLGLRALNESERASASRPLALMALNNAVRVPHLQTRIALEQTPLTIAASADGAYVALLAGTGRLVELRKGPDCVARSPEPHRRCVQHGVRSARSDW